MKLTIRIELSNDAFVENTGYEIQRILIKAAERIKDLPEPMKYGETLKDYNGNTCGEISVD